MILELFLQLCITTAVVPYDGITLYNPINGETQTELYS